MRGNKLRNLFWDCHVCSKYPVMPKKCVGSSIGMPNVIPYTSIPQRTHALYSVQWMHCNMLMLLWSLIFSVTHRPWWFKGIPVCEYWNTLFLSIVNINRAVVSKEFKTICFQDLSWQGSWQIYFYCCLAMYSMCLLVTYVNHYTFDNQVKAFVQFLWCWFDTVTLKSELKWHSWANKFRLILPEPPHDKILRH